MTKAILTNLTHLEADEGLDRSVRRAAKEGRHQRLESASNVVGTARALHRWFWENDAAFVELSFDDLAAIGRATKNLARALASFDRA